jgi:regulatory protein
MPKITTISLQKNNKNRCNLFIDGEFYKGISLESVYKNRLKEGQEISLDKLDYILMENERNDALSKALNYISKTLKTKRQVFDYLTKKGYSEEISYQVIDKLKEYKYLDDENYSKRYIESINSQGPKLVQYKLMGKGVKKQDIDKAFEDAEVDYNAMALAVLEKYLRSKEITKENLAKAYRYLLGRGFSYEQVDFALSRFKENV